MSMEMRMPRPSRSWGVRIRPESAHPRGSGCIGLLLLAVCASSCAGRGCRPQPPPAANRSQTTEGEIAVQNLEGQIRSAEMGLQRSPDQAQFLATLSALLQTRGQFLGRFADYERAEELANRLISVAPEDPQSYLARAGIRST